jgi:hypothetical protein
MSITCRAIRGDNGIGMSGSRGLWNRGFKDPRLSEMKFYSLKAKSPPTKVEHGLFGFWARRFFGEGPCGEAAQCQTDTEMRRGRGGGCRNVIR